MDAAAGVQGGAQAAGSAEPETKGRARKVRSDCKVSEADLYAAIVLHLGVLKYVALAVGLRRWNVYRRIARNPQLQTVLEAARAVVVSVAWKQFDKALEAKAPWAIMFLISRDEGLPEGSYEPRAGGVAGATAESKIPQEVEPQPELANASTLKLVQALERGERWAIKYCLSHLEPDGQCGINRLRRRVEDSDEAEGEPQVEEDASEVEVVEDPEKIHDFELATKYIVANYEVLAGRLPSAPPVAKAGPTAPSVQSAPVVLTLKRADAIYVVSAREIVAEPEVCSPRSREPGLPAAPRILELAQPNSSEVLSQHDLPQAGTEDAVENEEDFEDEAHGLPVKTPTQHNVLPASPLIEMEPTAPPVATGGANRDGPAPAALADSAVLKGAPPTIEQT